MQWVWKVETPEKTHLWLLSSLHTKFQFPSSIGRGDMEETPLFQDQKGENPSYPPPNWCRKLIFINVTQLWIVYRLAEKETFLAILAPQHPSPQIWAYLNFNLKFTLPRNIKISFNLSLSPKFDRFWSVSNRVNNFQIEGRWEEIKNENKYPWHDQK